MQLQSGGAPLTIADMPSPGKSASSGAAEGPFPPGALVVVTMHTPREKFWGAILELSSSGLSVRGVDLDSFDDFVSLIKAGEADPVTVFFPMHRVERIELDAHNGAIPSIAERFAEKTRRAAVTVLFPPSRSPHA